MEAKRLRKWPLLISYTNIGRNVETEWLHIDQDATLEVYAGLILSASKRLMNNLFFACDTATAPVIYTDTDSVNIPYHLRKQVAEAFDRLFMETMGCPLVGTELGQFHSDFDLSDPSTGKAFDADLIRSIFTVIVGRKLYLHVLAAPRNDGSKVYGYKMSCKGFPKEAVLYYARRFFDKARKRDKYNDALTPEVTDKQLRGLAMMFVAMTLKKKIRVNLYPAELKRSNFKFDGRNGVTTSQHPVFRTMVMTHDEDLEYSKHLPLHGDVEDPFSKTNDYGYESDSEIDELEEEIDKKTNAVLESELEELENLHNFELME